MNARTRTADAERGTRRSRRTAPAAPGEASRIAGPRLVLMAAVCALTALGLVMVFSASAVTGLTEEGSAQGQFVSQFAFIGIGVALAIAVAKVFDYRQLIEWSPMLVVASMAVLVFTRVAGVNMNGATRWLRLGPVSIQPSEFAKICLILCIVYIFCTVKRKDRAIGNPEFLKLGGLCLVTAGLIAIQPDKGTFFVLAMALWVLLILDGYDRRTLVVVAGIFIAAYLIYAMSEDYSRRRVLALIDPFADEADTGYQLAHGFYAFASGGLFGRGLGMGLQKYAYLPEAHNDFILPVIGEELGLLGVLFVFACFGLIAWAGYRIAQEANDREGRFLAIGCVALLVGQAALNFSGVLGVAPMTGKAVPFVSAGGSSMLASMAIVGLLCNVSLRTVVESAPDRRRKAFRVASDSIDRVRPERSYVVDLGFRVIPGGAQASTAPKAPLTRRDLREVGRGAAQAAGARRTRPERPVRLTSSVAGGRPMNRYGNDLGHGRERSRRAAGGR